MVLRCALFALLNYGLVALLSPASAEPWTNRINTCANGTGSDEQAVAACSTIIEAGIVWIPADKAKIQTARGNAYFRLGQYDKAKRDFDQAIAYWNTSSMAFNGACMARAALNEELNIALADCNRSLELEPNNVPALDSRAFVDFRTNAFADAIKDSSTALAFDPQLASSLFIRGLAELKSGDEDRGRADIAKAKAIQPDIEEQFSRMGVQ